MKKLVALLVIVVIGTGCVNAAEDISGNLAWQGVTGAQGHLVMIGGGARPDSVMRHIVQLSRDKSVLIIPMASASPQETGNSQAAEFLELGASSAEVLMLSSEDRSNADVARRIASANAIWFSGGDQNRLMQWLGSGVLLTAVKQAYFDGAVISGTSAGTAVISQSMITGDEISPADDHNFGVMVEHNVATAPGIGLLTNLIVDQHFIMRSRLNRLISVLLDKPEFLAAGIDEATALWIQPDGRAEVLGESQVILLQEPRGDTHPGSQQNHLHLSVEHSRPRLQATPDIRLSILPPGSRFRLTDDGITDLVLPAQ
ncbi:MAG: cyanophycinase [Gammaproteobacteria bacterium]|nr:cyanophycinase [Gammaproteobacteria bacterium]